MSITNKLIESLEELKLTIRKTIIKRFLFSFGVFMTMLYIAIDTILSTPENADVPVGKALLILTMLVVGFFGTIISAIYAIIGAIKYLDFKKSTNYYLLGNYEKAYELAIPLFRWLLYFQPIEDYINLLKKKLNLSTEETQAPKKTNLPKELIDQVAEQLNAIDNQIDNLKKRINKYTRMQNTLEKKLQNLKKDALDIFDKELIKEYQRLIDKYQDMLEFIKFKIATYREIKSRLEKLKNRIIHLEILKLEHEQLKKYEDALLKEGYKSEYQDQDLLNFYQTQTVYVNYITQFLKSDENIQTKTEFDKLKQKLYLQLKNLGLDDLD